MRIRVLGFIIADLKVVDYPHSTRESQTVLVTYQRLIPMAMADLDTRPFPVEPHLDKMLVAFYEFSKRTVVGFLHLGCKTACG